MERTNTLEEERALSGIMLEQGLALDDMLGMNTSLERKKYAGVREGLSQPSVGAVGMNAVPPS